MKLELQVSKYSCPLKADTSLVHYEHEIGSKRFRKNASPKKAELFL